MLPSFTSLDKLLDLLRTCKRVVVVTGAGIRQEKERARAIERKKDASVMAWIARRYVCIWEMESIFVP